MLKLAIFLFFILVIIVLLFQANHEIWSGHLKTDVDVFYTRANYFIYNLNLSQIGYNEYQPGALLFFIILSPVLLISNSSETFTSTLITANVLLLFILAFLYQKFTNYKSIFIFSLILLFTGPIIFFRFELLVVGAVIATLYLWKKNHNHLAAVTLAIATLIKIFPIILLPYFLIKNYKKARIMSALTFFLTYIISLTICLGLFILIFQANLIDLQNSLNYHASKSVSIESTWGTLISLTHTIIFNTYPTLEGNFRMWALERHALFLPLSFYNYFWILPVFLLYTWLFRIKKEGEKLDTKFIIVLFFSFILSSKVQAPQYLLWFALLIPILGMETMLSNKNFLISFFLLLLVLFITQFIYPLSFGNFVQFYTEGNHQGIFWINAMRNLCMIGLLIVFLIADINNKKL